MAKLSRGLVAVVAVIQAAIAAIEMFFWTQPWVYERLQRGFDEKQALQVAPIVQNAGLYNGFLAAGLVWSLLARSGAYALRGFFLSCVMVAGVFGAGTLKPTTLLIQSLPAALALALTPWTSTHAHSERADDASNRVL